MGPLPVAFGRPYGSALCLKYGESGAGFPVDLGQFRQCCLNVQLCPPQKVVPKLEQHPEMAQKRAGRFPTGRQLL